MLYYKHHTQSMHVNQYEKIWLMGIALYTHSVM